ncbi:AAA family ATPase [Kiloniella litopenaei]|uniref:AAA family ATPase n=1 Tax=Kiloniella litopenaei TaxID=1549748 RepID=UPI003BAD6555
MKRQFVTTENTLRFLEGFSALEKRGAEEACLMVVDGVPGLGKTSIIEWWAGQTGSVFLRAKKEWKPNWLLSELIEALGQVPRHGFEKRFKQATEILANKHEQFSMDRRPFAVVIDEIDHISNSEKMLETLRDLSDTLELPFIFVGMGKVRTRLTKFPQIASRVGQYVQFQDVSLDDVLAMAKNLCEVPIKRDLIEFLHRASRRKMREIKEGLSSIERFGAINPGKEIGLDEMAGKLLLNDRITGKPILVTADGFGGDNE